MAAVSYCLAVLLIVARGAAGGERARFDHYQVFRLTPSSATQLHLLNALNARPDGLEFLSEPSAVARSVNVMVAPHQRPADYQRHRLRHHHTGRPEVGTTSYLPCCTSSQRILSGGNEHISHVVFTKDRCPVSRQDGESSGKNSTDYDWETYQDLPELNARIDATVARHPEAASIIVAGSSFEGRPLKGVRICHGPGRPVVFVEAGIDGAEWPSVSTATFLVHQLLTNDSEAVRRVAQAFDWHVLPTANPDGYNYAHTTMEVAGISAEALSRRYGTKYQTGTIFDVFGGVSGSSVDWVKKWLGARFVFEYDLRDTGGFGLLLPPAQVRPAAEETADSLVAMMREVLARTAAPH
ncbi:zinc carboxypeptidase A 1-like [Schistocerca americana]|uniref:zinc carboxypeptidase A 1-like n=1 Tax=Schistocerca americana TaxID=7009 RepID=UPI001F4F373F|nr:zinc carboxypeptidase A 1-like [Schistocerca americana]